MAIILGRHQIYLDLEKEVEAASDDSAMQSVVQLNCNAHLSQFFRSLAREVRLCMF